MSWWQMQAVHEFGHLLAAVLTSEQISVVNLHPLQLSFTLLASHRYSITFLWAGPILGVLLPLFLWQLTKIMMRGWSHVFRFFTGFCLIANGAYLGSAAFAAYGDAKGLLQHEVSIFWLLAFAVITIPTGFYLWNGQGRYFGLGKHANQVTPWQISRWLLGTIIWFALTSLMFPIQIETTI